MMYSATELALLPAALAKPKFTQEELDNMYLEAVMLHKYARYDEAEAKAKQIQAQLPDNPDVKKLLSEIARARQSLGDKRPDELKRILTEIIVPEVNLCEAVVQDVFKFLQEESGRLAKDKKPVNFVSLVPADTEPGIRKVTLSLRKVPMIEVIKYVTLLTDLRYRIEEHAVVIYKDSPAGASQQ